MTDEKKNAKKPLTPEEARAAKLERQRDFQERSDNDFLWLMNDARGRRIVWAQLSECGVFRTSFTGNSTTFFNEGKRDVGLRILDRITKLCPEAYVTMTREAQIDNEVIENG